MKKKAFIYLCMLLTFLFFISSQIAIAAPIGFTFISGTVSRIDSVVTTPPFQIGEQLQVSFTIDDSTPNTSGISGVGRYEDPTGTITYTGLTSGAVLTLTTGVIIEFDSINEFELSGIISATDLFLEDDIDFETAVSEPLITNPEDLPGSITELSNLINNNDFFTLENITTTNFQFVTNPLNGDRVLEGGRVPFELPSPYIGFNFISGTVNRIDRVVTTPAFQIGEILQVSFQINKNTLNSSSIPGQARYVDPTGTITYTGLTSGAVLNLTGVAIEFDSVNEFELDGIQGLSTYFLEDDIDFETAPGDPLISDVTDLEGSIDELAALVNAENLFTPKNITTTNFQFVRENGFSDRILQAARVPFDNCPLDINPNQEDADLDQVGDVCDDFPNDPSEQTDNDNDLMGDNFEAFFNVDDPNGNPDGDFLNSNFYTNLQEFQNKTDPNTPDSPFTVNFINPLYSLTPFTTIGLNSRSLDFDSNFGIITASGGDPTNLGGGVFERTIFKYTAPDSNLPGNYSVSEILLTYDVSEDLVSPATGSGVRVTGVDLIEDQSGFDKLYVSETAPGGDSGYIRIIDQSDCNIPGNMRCTIERTIELPDFRPTGIDVDDMGNISISARKASDNTFGETYVIPFSFTGTTYGSAQGATPLGQFGSRGIEREGNDFYLSTPDPSDGVVPNNIGLVGDSIYSINSSFSSSPELIASFGQNLARELRFGPDGALYGIGRRLDQSLTGSVIIRLQKLQTGTVTTEDGASVETNPIPEVSLTFDQVDTAGETTVTVSPENPGPTSNFGFAGSFFDVNTTSAFTGEVEICITYDETTLVGGETIDNLIIYHLVNNLWEPLITTSFDSTANEVCANTSSFSYFASAECLRTSIDSDDDSLLDCAENSIGTNPNSTDTDTDGLSDFDELNRDGDPTNYTPGVDTDPGSDPDTAIDSNVVDPKDTDGDGFSDGDEVNAGSDPLLASSIPTPTVNVPVPLWSLLLIALSIILVGMKKFEYK